MKEKKLHSATQGGYHRVHFNRPLPNDNWPYHNHPANGNDPQYGYRGPKFERHIYVRKDQILFDLDAQISMVADARRGQDGTEQGTLSNGTSRYQQMFYRWIDKYVGLAMGVLSAYTLEKFKTQKFNSISTEDEIDIELLMPDYWDDTVFDQLVNAVHDYIANSVLYEYFALTLTSKDPVTNDKRSQADQSLYDVKRFANQCKPGRFTKKEYPF